MVSINAGYMVFQPEIFDYLKEDSTVLEHDPLEKLLVGGEGALEEVGKLRENDAE